MRWWRPAPALFPPPVTSRTFTFAQSGGRGGARGGRPALGDHFKYRSTLGSTLGSAADSTPHQYQAPHRCQHLEQPHTPHPGGHEAGWQLASLIFSSEENECRMDAGIRQIYTRPDSYLGQARGRYSGRLCTPHCSNGCVHGVHCGQCEVSSALLSLHCTTLYFVLPYTPCEALFCKVY